MTVVETFLRATETRIPDVGEMIALCDELGIGFTMSDSRPALRFNDGNRAEAELLARLFKREPFRSRVIAERMNGHAAKKMPVGEICAVCGGTVFDPTIDNGCDKPRCPYPIKD